MLFGAFLAPLEPLLIAFLSDRLIRRILSQPFPVFFFFPPGLFIEGSAEFRSPAWRSRIFFFFLETGTLRRLGLELSAFLSSPTSQGSSLALRLADRTRRAPFLLAASPDCRKRPSQSSPSTIQMRAIYNTPILPEIPVSNFPPSLIAIFTPKVDRCRGNGGLNRLNVAFRFFFSGGRRVFLVKDDAAARDDPGHACVSWISPLFSFSPGCIPLVM